MKETKLSGGSLNARAFGWRAAITDAVLPVILGVSLVSAASAAVVFEQEPVNGNDAFPSISAAQSADGFVLPTTTSVTGLRWWGSYSQDPTTLPADVFSVRIFADDGSPGETISQQPTRSSSLLVDKTGAAVYRFDLVLAPFTLAGGKDWYLSVINQFDVRDPTAVWYWLLSNATDENFYRSADGDPWLSDSTGNLAFQVIGNPGRAIPLPGSLLLLLAGLAGLNLVRLRSRLRLTTPVDG